MRDPRRDFCFLERVPLCRPWVTQLLSINPSHLCKSGPLIALLIKAEPMEDPKLPVSVDNSFATDLNGDAHADESLLADEEPLEGTRDRTLSTPPAPPLEPSSPVGKDKSARSDAAEAPEKEEPFESGELDQPSALEPSPEVQAPASAHEEAEPESPPPPSPSTNGHSSGPVADQKEGEEVKRNGLAKEETDAPASEGAEAPKEAGVGEKVKRLVAKPAGVVASAKKAFESKTGSTTGTSLSLCRGESGRQRRQGWIRSLCLNSALARDETGHICFHRRVLTFLLSRSDQASCAVIPCAYSSRCVCDRSTGYGGDQALVLSHPTHGVFCSCYSKASCPLRSINCRCSYVCVEHRKGDRVVEATCPSCRRSVEHDCFRRRQKVRFRTYRGRWASD